MSRPDLTSYAVAERSDLLALLRTLTDGTIHHQDVRRALGLPRDVPAERLVRVLDVAMTAPTLPARVHAKGLRLVATDLDWSHGSGPDVIRPGEAVLMAVTGRSEALGGVADEGAGTLADRVSRAG